ncbi:hypothetical protein RYO59_001823 [Thermosynechococcaceae cyanobacterium Okahandja]
MTIPDPAFSPEHPTDSLAAIPPELMRELFDAALLEALVSPELPDLDQLFVNLEPLRLESQGHCLSQEQWQQLQVQQQTIARQLEETLTYLAKVKAVAYQLQAVASEFVPTPKRRQRQAPPPHPLEYLAAELLRAIAHTQAALEPVYEPLHQLGDTLSGTIKS